MRGPTYVHAPLFSGSSWHQRMSAFGYASRWGVIWERERERERVRRRIAIRDETRWTHQVVWEGRDLLESADRDVLNAPVLTFLQKGVVHLT